MGSPGFVATVAVLAANDHLLKERFPGWWTGKLSDVAGVAMVAVLVSVLTGPTVGTALTGAAFVVLKAVPGGAEAAAPVLGGVTLQDRTDLVALVVLPAVWWRMRRTDPTDPPEATFATTRLHAERHRSRVASAVIPLVAGSSAILTATATQCAPEDAVVQVGFDGPALVAGIDHGYTTSRWARSDDGGRTWTEADAPPATVSTPPATAPPRDREPSPAGPLEACRVDGTCFRVRDQQFIDQVAPDGRVTTELALTDAEFNAATTRCAGGERGVLGSIAARDDVVVASAAAGGVFRRTEAGTWERQAVLDIPVPAPTWVDDSAFLLVLGVGPTTAVAAYLARRRLARWWAVALVAVGGAVATMSLAGLVSVASPVQAGQRPATIAALAGVGVTVVLAVLVGGLRRSSPTAPRPPTPPPS